MAEEAPVIAGASSSAPDTVTAELPSGTSSTGSPELGRRARRAIIGTSRLPKPETVQRGRILWPYAVSLSLYHLLALLAFVPWFFSWTGVLLAFLGLYVFGTLGINLCYHRLLTHRGLACPRWLERTFAVLGVCCLQDTPARWVAIHRMHHQHSDEQPDPHSPLVTFFWSHVGWLLVDNRELNSVLTYDRYARDILRDPFYFAFERNLLWVWVNLAQWLVYYLGGFAAGWLATGTVMGGVQFGLSLLVWGVVVRTVAVWHITWSVNSLSHLWGYRNYETDENSRNNWFVALVSNGEGWHNNHHADQRSASHGHYWYEFDVTWLTIALLARLGLARDVVLPGKALETRSTAG
jgi:stearoyl-CoA desaturase (delta-9 desaturase)